MKFMIRSEIEGVTGVMTYQQAEGQALAELSWLMPFPVIEFRDFS